MKQEPGLYGADLQDTSATEAQIRALVESQIESDEPDRILEVFRKNEGKALTVRLLPQLPGGSERWQIARSAGMTQLVERTYYRTSGNEGYCFYLSYDTTHVVISAKELTERNSCHFAARIERNNKRRASLADNGAIQALAFHVDQARAARKALEYAEKMIECRTGHGETFSPDSYEIAKLYQG